MFVNSFGAPTQYLYLLLRIHTCTDTGYPLINFSKLVVTSHARRHQFKFGQLRALISSPRVWRLRVDRCQKLSTQMGSAACAYWVSGADSLDSFTYPYHM